MHHGLAARTFAEDCRGLNRALAAMAGIFERRIDSFTIAGTRVCTFLLVHIVLFGWPRSSVGPVRRLAPFLGWATFGAPDWVVEINLTEIGFCTT